VSSARFMKILAYARKRFVDVLDADKFLTATMRKHVAVVCTSDQNAGFNRGKVAERRRVLNATFMLV